MNQETAVAKASEFSLILGGPVYQFLLRTGLVRPPLDRVKWRMFVISMVCWAPLVVLTLLDQRFFSGVKIPFLWDFDVHVRLLVCLPLLILGEVIIHTRMKAIVAQFIERRIILAPMLDRFEECTTSALRLRNSTVIELGLIAVVLLGGSFWWREVMELQSDTWYISLTAGGTARRPAGFWYQTVSVPICQFIAIRWYFRLFIWIRFLWQVSKLDLNLVPTHPDRSCGLGFLDGIVSTMAPFLLAHSCILAGALANRLLYAGARLPDYYAEIGALSGLLFLVTLGPLCFFTRALLRARLQGLHDYGRFASDYVIAFDRKWIRGQRQPDEPLVGTGDIQSLADLANSFAVVQTIIPFPFGRNSLVELVVITTLPLLPLLLTMFSFEELATRLIRLVF